MWSRGWEKRRAAGPVLARSIKISVQNSGGGSETVGREGGSVGGVEDGGGGESVGVDEFERALITAR